MRDWLLRHQKPTNPRYLSSRGRIEAAQVTCGALQVSNSDGSLIFNDIESAGPIDLFTSNSQIKIGTIINGTRCKVETSNGRIYSGPISVRYLKMQTTNSMINVDGKIECESAEFKVRL